MADDTYDVIVIGGGPAGENAALYAIKGSRRTAVIVEAELVGGECSYWACMPSKALLRPVEVVDAGRALPGVTQMLSGSLDVPAVLERRDTFTHHRDDSSQVAWANENGIEVVRGRGRLAGERTVEIGHAGIGDAGRTLTARHAVVIATGTTASIPPVDGLRDAAPWTSRDVTNLREVPARVAVIGGGVVACESVTWLQGMGAREITVIDPEPALLAQQEPFVGELIAERFRGLGIEVLVGTGVDAVERAEIEDTGVGRIHGGPATFTAGGSTFEVDEIVVAAGRTPATADLGLERVGIDVSGSHGYLETDDHMELAGGWLYAVGDACGRALLTHMGKYQARIAGDVIAARAEGRPLDGGCYRDVSDHDMVPAVVFTDPQVASVGLTESRAREKGIEVEALEQDLASVAGASLLRDDYVGRAKLVVDRATDTLVGATFVGSDVTELLHSATTAVVGKVPLETLWHAVPSYPTVSEVWLRLLEARD